MAKTYACDELIICEKQPSWLVNNNDRLLDEDIKQIILFFVVFSPCQQYCTQGRTLQFYGWKEKPWSTNKYLKSKLDSAAFSDKRRWFICVDEIPKMVDAVRKTNLEEGFYQHRDAERVAFFKSEDSEYMSLFYHIRCALAHGRFALFEEDTSKDVVIIMENGVNKGKGFQVKARMVLRKSTLIKWMDIIKQGPAESEKTYYKEVYEALLENKKLRIKDMARMYDETEYVIQKAIKKLKQWNVVSYQNHGSNSWWEVNVFNAETFFKKL